MALIQECRAFSGLTVLMCDPGQATLLQILDESFGQPVCRPFFLESFSSMDELRKPLAWREGQTVYKNLLDAAGAVDSNRLLP